MELPLNRRWSILFTFEAGRVFASRIDKVATCQRAAPAHADTCRTGSRNSMNAARAYLAHIRILVCIDDIDGHAQFGPHGSCHRRLCGLLTQFRCGSRTRACDVMEPRCLLFPHQRTCHHLSAMSAKCQQRDSCTASNNGSIRSLRRPE